MLPDSRFFVWINGLPDLLRRQIDFVRLNLTELKWKTERDKRYLTAFDKETMQKAFQRIDAVNDALLNVMIEIYGMDVPKKQEDAKLEECLECSKLAQGLRYMQSTISKFYAFSVDLKQPYCKDVIGAVGVAVGVASGKGKARIFKKDDVQRGCRSES